MTFPPPGFAWRTFSGNIAGINAENGFDIDAHTVDTRWIGERMDYSLAIDALIVARTRQRQREASQADA